MALDHAVEDVERDGETVWVLVPEESIAASGGDGRVWLATAEAVYPVDVDTGSSAGRIIDRPHVSALAAAGSRLWICARASRWSRSWDVSDRDGPVPRGFISIGGAPSSSPARRSATACWSSTRAACTSWLRQGSRRSSSVALGPDGANVGSATNDLGAPIAALTMAGGRVYAVGGGVLSVVEMTPRSARLLARVDAPLRVTGVGTERPAASQLVVAGDRLLAALGANGAAAWSLSPPDLPIVLERYGSTLQGERSIAVAATGAATVAFDPLGTTFDDGAGRGPIGAVGHDGCKDAEDGWSVAIDVRRAIAVRVPVRSDLAAMSTVRATIGDRTTVVAPEAEGERGVVVFTGTVPAADPGTSLDGALVRIAIVGPEPATWQGGAVAPRVWLPWVGR